MTTGDAFRKGFAPLDILDIAELTFGDFGCFQTYGTAWLVCFDIFLVLAILLTSVFYGLEQRKRKYEVEDTVFTVLKLIFNDLSFLILRIKKMTEQGHPYIGILFVTKEILSIINRVMLLIYRDSQKKNRYNKFGNNDENDTRF